MLSVEQIAHREYLKSATWQDIRTEVLKRDNNICVNCKNPGYDVHHKHYKNWGNEQLKDLITLCRTCHEQWHSTQNATKKSKTIGNRAIFNYLNNSQKQKIFDKFNLSDVLIYNEIYYNENKEVLDYACKLLGYNNWYSQSPKYRINKKKTFN